MGGITSNAIYLASSLTAASNASAVAAETTVVPVIVADAPQPTQPITPLSRGYVILDVPAAARPPETPNLGELINTEIRRHAEQYSAPGPVTSPWAAGPGESAPLAGDTGDMDRDVLAEHETRIALLKQRIDRLRADHKDNAAALIRDLGTRLKRAQAARKLAMARAILTGDNARPGEQIAASLSGDSLPPVSAPSAHKPIARLVTGKHGNVIARATPDSPKPRDLAIGRAPRAYGRSLSLGQMATAKALNGVQLAHATAAGWRSSRVHHVTTRRNAPTDRRLVASTKADRTSAYRLAHARRLLSNARTKLASAGKPPAVSIRTVGLWQWDGSDKWTLASYRRPRA
ncbi:hypothetical protein ACM61V_00725 [Sphingomonas sp. TX0543]|uniref:hypothetical protein n=1 Tax=unclassified Sphingomonas TaxID=196159 RepID=UPI0010F87DFD|nr:hypothetical protein [Sphingomonas sp. 3P27F8]